MTNPSNFPYSGSFAIAPPPPVVTADIESDGGRWVQVKGGRTVEYFVCGSNQADAAILVDCPGGGCTGKLVTMLPGLAEWCIERNVRVISPSYPGLGRSDVQPGWTIADWPCTDLEPILQKEGVIGDDSKCFSVSGASFGSPHAMAVAAHFGPDCVKAVGLRVPYIGRPTSGELGLCQGQPNMGYTSESANTRLFGHIIGKMFMAVSGSPGSFMNEPSFAQKLFMQCMQPNALKVIQKLNQEYPEYMEVLKADMDRGVVHSTQGWLYMCASDTLLDHGFDVRDIQVNKFVVWYADDDEDCPPSHGIWVADHFEVKARRVFTGTGHIGAAFIDHINYLDQLLFCNE